MIKKQGTDDCNVQELLPVVYAVLAWYDVQKEDFSIQSLGVIVMEWAIANWF